VVETALKEFETAPAPRFLWIHLMDSHRPYGSGETAVPVDIDRKALFAPNRLSTSEIETIDSKYRAALQRVDDRIERLVDGLPTDPILIFSSDHGDEFGEEGRYFHQPQRCRVVDSLVEVPVASSDLAVDFERCSLLDLAPTLLGDLGIDTPDQWHGKNLANGNRHSALTIAPWHERATIGWRDFTTETTVIGKNADVTVRQGSDRVDVEQQEIPDDLKDQLRDLGYRT
jgi:arylsulfatase A-like enzyme